MNPCWNGQFGRVEVRSGSMIRSRVLAMLERRDMGLKEVFRFGGLFGFSKGMMEDSFHRCGIELLFMAVLNNDVRKLIARGPRCLRW